MPVVCKVSLQDFLPILAALWPKIPKYAKRIAKCEKLKAYSGVFHATFFTFRAPFFKFHSISRRSGHSQEKSKDFLYASGA